MIRIEVITGPMFSGKTEELMKRLNKATHGQKKILVAKPIRDTRTKNTIAARRKDEEDGAFRVYKEMGAYEIQTEEQFLNLVLEKEPQVIGIDEVHFFDEWLPGFLGTVMELYLEEADLLIIAAGLDMDAWRRPFGIMPQLMAMADEVRKESAVCFKCHGKNGPAIFTQKTGGSAEQIEIGDAEIYEARCRVCYMIPS